MAWLGIIRAPGLAVIAVASLAIAIGGNTAMFSVIEALFVRIPPYAEPEELVRLTGPMQERDFSYATFRHLESATEQTFDGMAGVTFNRSIVSDETGQYGSPAHGLVVGPYFQVLGVEAQIGRVFTPDEGVGMGTDPLIVLSDEYWRRTFDGDPAVVGHDVMLNGFRHTIVGVAAPGFSGVVPGLKSAFWALPAMANQIYVAKPSLPGAFRQGPLTLVARLAAGVSLTDARTSVQAAVFRQGDTHSGTDSEFRIEVAPILASAAHPELVGFVRPVVTMVSGVLVVLLLLAFVNLATLFLARAEGRRQEFAVYVALGTGRLRLVRRFLAETTTVALLGGVAGVCLSEVLLGATGTLQLPTAPPFPLTVDHGLNSTVLLFAICLSLLAGLLMGLAPSISLAHPGVTTTFGEKRTGGSRRAARARATFLVTQVALTTMLVVAGGGYAQTWFIAHRQDPGFGRHPVAVVSLALGPDRSEDERRSFNDAYLRDITDLPGVVSAGAATVLPLQHVTSMLGIEIPGVDPPPGGGRHMIDWVAVDGDYFDAMGIPLLAGRSFNSRDDPASPTVAIVSETTAGRFWPSQDPVGRELNVCEGCWVTVVGVVGDIKARKMSEAPRPVIYTRMAQSPYVDASFVARTMGDPTSVVPAMTAAGDGLDSPVYLFSAGTLKQHVSDSLTPLRAPAVLLCAIGGFALFLAAIGVYGIVSYTVAARKRELAIRMSLGANPSRLAIAVLRSTAKLIAAGLGVGWLLTVVAERALRETPYPLKPFGPVVFACSVALLAGVGILAAYLSVRRAIRLYPMYALKED